jgi:hypothetical protein
MGIFVETPTYEKTALPHMGDGGVGEHNPNRH